MRRCCGQPRATPIRARFERPAMRALFVMLFVGLTLAAPLSLATSASADGLADMTDAERAAFREEVRAYLVENPEVIVEAMDVLQSRQDAAAAQSDQQTLSENAALIYSDPASWVGGNPDGDITLVEFMDYRCGYCRKAHSEIEELVKSDGNIRFVLKEFPILGEESVTSSRFAIAVRMIGGDDAYKAVHDALITLRGAPDEATLGRMATDLGLDAAAVLSRMASDDVTAVIDANHALAATLAISGTPTFIIDQTMLRGYVPLEDMRKLVGDARAG